MGPVQGVNRPGIVLAWQHDRLEPQLLQQRAAVHLAPTFSAKLVADRLSQQQR